MVAYQPFTFLIVPHKSPLYVQATQLRDKILRIPLGRKLDPAELEAETADHHLVCMHQDQVVASLTLTRQSETLIRARQVAVDEYLQGKQVGSRLMAYAEGYSRGLGYTHLTLHAREPAMNFYLKLGYAIEGDRFIEVGMGHYIMTRCLL